ncbi:MAG: SET domain-containing protein-lysine N-methyltransferase [Burkholderiales bacterium]
MPSKKSAVKPDNQPLYIVKKSELHGNGVFAARKIAEDTQIIEYTGKRTSWKEALKRDPADPDHPFHTFLFDLGDGRYVIDAAIGGNDARWINHGCRPNCQALDEDGRIFIYALRDIKRGEELLYDYGLILEERHTAATKRDYACRCGAPNCRGTMLGKKR